MFLRFSDFFVPCLCSASNFSCSEFSIVVGVRGLESSLEVRRVFTGWVKVQVRGTYDECGRGTGVFDPLSQF